MAPQATTADHESPLARREPADNGPVIAKSAGAGSPRPQTSPPRVPESTASEEVGDNSPKRETDAETAAALASVADALKGAAEGATPPNAPPEPESGNEIAGSSSEDGASASDVAFDEDPLVDSEQPIDDFADESTPFDDDYESPYTHEEENEEEVSHFEYRAPFTSRRNPLKMWSIAAGVFALLAAGTIGAVNYYGIPPGLGLPFSGPTFGIGKPDLILDFPAAEQRTETLGTGVEIFRVRGTVTNSGSASSSVPRLIVVFVDERGREVFSKIIVPAKTELAPGESLNVTEGISDYPASASTARLGWAPN
ncbi:MAG: hypothetical protein HRT64_06480 [Erythrobacter sp.]|nr:hypothetical protein [Erythrobacter sp.]